ncbi:MAG: asparaginase [Bdellovibrionaceae bacterium]|nr:asparaginase [Pseudobdellovibrionaceae bacterium]
MKNIWILTTGGTIEKSYSEDEGSLENRESLLQRKLIEKLRIPYTEVKVKTLMAKDSLHMTDEDREIIFQSIKESLGQCDGIVVLHGTDTLDKTLLYCYNQLAKPSIPVVFTGAMKPAGFDDSDALQNFTEALYASQVVAPGYYLSFHGHLFHGPNFKKNKLLRTFESSND